MNMFKRIVKLSLLSLLFIMPLTFNASYLVEGNEESFESLENANKLCKKQKSCIVKLESDEFINEDVVLDENIDLSIIDKKLIVNENAKLTILGDLNISNNAKMIVNGELEILGDINLTTLSTLTINGTLTLNNGSKITVNAATIDFPNAAKLNSNDTNTIDVLNYGTLKGNRSAFTKTLLTVNNYNSKVENGINKALSNYNNYLLFDMESNNYYMNLDDVPSSSTVYLTKPLEVNGDTTLNEGVKLIIQEGNGLEVNGSLTVNGEIVFEKGYSYIKTYYLLGNGKISLNKANTLDIGYTTYITILKELSNDITFDAVDGYSPASGDILFAIGTDSTSANIITNNIHLSNKYGSLKINTIVPNAKLVNGGNYIGKLYSDNSLNDIALASAKVSNTIDNSEVYYVLLIVFSLTAFITYMAAKLVFIERK